MNHQLKIEAVPQNVIDGVTQKFTEIQQLLATYMVTLSGAARQSLPKTSDKSISFVTKCNDYSKSNPEFVPNFMDVAAFDSSLNTYILLQPLTKLANLVCRSLSDTALQNGSHALTASLQYYNFVKQADLNKVQNAKQIYSDLSVRFAGRKTKKPETELSKDDGSRNDDSPKLKVA